MERAASPPPLMDVPYRSSGSSSRQHYALVRKVEAEHSSSVADQHLLLEVEVVRGQISDPGLSLVSWRDLQLQHSRSIHLETM